MKYLNFIVEGTTEEVFVNEILSKYLFNYGIVVSVRKIRTGWDNFNNKPAKGGLISYLKLKNDIKNWIISEKNRQMTWYTTMVDLYAFPKDNLSPFSLDIQGTSDPYQKISKLEDALKNDINHSSFIPYVQLHEFETFLLVAPERLMVMYPNEKRKIELLKKEIGNIPPELINESLHSAPSKRIIKYIPNYEFEKAQVGPLIAEDIGLERIRNSCPHFNQWLKRLELI